MKICLSTLLGLLLLATPAFAQESGATAVNVAVVATPSASYTSGDTAVTALNDGNEARSSRDRRRGSYGHWPRRDTQWVQYDWSQPISTKQIEVYWWDDRQGVRLPKASRLKYWDGKKFSVFVRVPDRKTSELYTSTPEVKGLKSFSVNGKAMTPKIENGYAVVTRDWKAGEQD